MDFCLIYPRTMFASCQIKSQNDKVIQICRFDEKRYTSACIEPPVPKLFFAELDALNDCLVIENLEQVDNNNFTQQFFAFQLIN